MTRRRRHAPSTLHFRLLATICSYAACNRSPTLGPAFLRRFTSRMGPPSDSNNHEFSGDVSVWRDFVRRPMGPRFGEDFLGQGPAGFMLGIGTNGGAAT